MKLEELIWLDKCEEVKKVLLKRCPELPENQYKVKIEKQDWTEDWWFYNYTYPAYDNDTVFCKVGFVFNTGFYPFSWSARISIDSKAENITVSFEAIYAVKFTAKTSKSFEDANQFIVSILKEAQSALESVK